MCSRVLTMTGPSIYFFMLCVLSSKSSLLMYCLSFSMYSSISTRTWFLCIASVRELVLSLFSLLLHLTFFLLPSSTSPLFLSSSTLVLPSIVVLLATISVMLPENFSFLSSSALLFVCSASFCLSCQICLHED